MTAAQLAASLRTAGLTVSELTGWQTRGHTWATGQPIGIMHHHTAPPVPYPPERLITDGRIKANMNTNPNVQMSTVGWGWWVGLEYSAANTFQFWASPDGVSWSTFEFSAVSKTMTPTHFGIAWSVDGAAGAAISTYGPIQKLA